MSTFGFGMRESILDAGIDEVVPSSKRIKYCGIVAGSIGMSITVPDRVMFVSGSVFATLFPEGKARW
jgi:hypothetical protein